MFCASWEMEIFPSSNVLLAACDFSTSVAADGGDSVSREGMMREVFGRHLLGWRKYQAANRLFIFKLLENYCLHLVRFLGS